MTPNMKAHLPQVDLDKMAAILDIETRFVEGRISLPTRGQYPPLPPRLH